MERKGGATSSSSVRVHVRSGPIFSKEGGGGRVHFEFAFVSQVTCTGTQQVRQA